jgi:hypothetical protein
MIISIKMLFWGILLLLYQRLNLKGFFVLSALQLSWGAIAFQACCREIPRPGRLLTDGNRTLNADTSPNLKLAFALIVPRIVVAS